MSFSKIIRIAFLNLKGDILKITDFQTLYFSEFVDCGAESCVTYYLKGNVVQLIYLIFRSANYDSFCQIGSNQFKLQFAPKINLQIQ